MKKLINKRKINRWCVNNITPDLIKSIVLLSLSTLILLPQLLKNGIDIDKLVDTSIILSFLAVAVCGLLASIVLKFVISKTEDAMKISDDYVELINKYPLEDIFKYVNSVNVELSFPEVLLACRKIKEDPFNIFIDNSNKDNRYQLPKQIEDNSEKLFNSHSASIIYNNINLRLDDFEFDKDKNEIKLLYSRTTYYDSLLTNRVMDYPFRGNRTIREMFEPGPLMSTLSVSKLSNHIGFNGFIETADGYYIFVKRANNLSIAKNTLSTSISASLKTKYALTKDRTMTLEGISNAIKSEIRDELKIEIDKDTDIAQDLSKSIFAFYRELSEGGKPQFLFYYKLQNLKKAEVENNFKKLANEGDDNKKKAIEDGIKLKFFTIDELFTGELNINSITIRDKKYPLVPTISFSIACLLSSL